MSGKAIYWKQNDLYLQIKATPRSSKNSFGQIKDGRLVVRLMAPPVEGKANKALVEFLSKQFKVAKTRIQLIRGENSRLKTICIPDPENIPQFVQEHQHA